MSKARDIADRKLDGVDLELGDNDKAVFGAGSDLQIYHDPVTANGFIKEGGAGSLKILGTNLLIKTADDTEYYIRCTKDDAVQLYYDNESKLATTSTGVDITGTVTADGLTVDNSGTAITITNGDGLTQLGKFSGDATNGFVIEGKSNNNLTLKTKANTLGEGIKFVGTSDNNLMFIDGTTGDISFYEDTGTTAKFFWDASTESLTVPKSRINDGSTGLDIVTRSFGVELGTYDVNQAIDIRAYGSTSASYLNFATKNADRMRIDGNGNVGIGTSSPSAPLDVTGDISYSGRLIARNTDADGSATSPAICVGWDYDTGFFRPATNTIGFSTAATERMRIDSSGNVGIGTSSPSEILDLSADNNPRLRFQDRGNFEYTIGIKDNDAFTISSGGTDTERMRIDSAGRVTMPYQPAVDVRLNFPAGGTSGTATTNSITVDRNNNWNSSTHRFTAPVAGTYAVTASFYTDYTGSYGYYGIYKNGGVHGTPMHYNNASGGSIHFPGAFTRYLYLNVGDYVQFGRTSSSGSSTFDATYLSVHLIG